MAGRTTIPKEWRDLIERLRRDGYTVTQIHEKLAQQAPTAPARSTVGRYTQKIDHVLAVHKSAVEMAKALGKQLGENENEMNRGLSEILSAKMLEVVVQGGNLEEAAAQVKVLQQLARAVADVAKAQHLDVNTITKIREEAEKEALKKAADKVGRVAKKQGLSEQARKDLISELAG